MNNDFMEGMDSPFLTLSLDEVLKNRGQEKVGRKIKEIGWKLEQGKILPNLAQSEINALFKSLTGSKDEKRPELISDFEFIEKHASTSYIIEGFLPEKAITVLAGKWGLGKTQLVLQLGKAIQTGEPIFGLKTSQRAVVYCNYDNPSGVLRLRLEQIGCSGIQIWGNPPKLDSEDWELFKKLSEGSVIIVDSFRSSHNLDENSSRDISVLFGRLSELRDLGYTVILLHHTLKRDEKIFRGSGTISDRADHIINLFPIRQKGADEELLEEVEDLDDPSICFYCGTLEKTRFTSFKIYLQRNPDTKLWTLTEDPLTKELKTFCSLIENLALELGTEPSTTQIIKNMKGEGYSQRKTLAFLRELEKRNMVEVVNRKSERSKRPLKTYRIKFTNLHYLGSENLKIYSENGVESLSSKGSKKFTSSENFWKFNPEGGNLIRYDDSEDKKVLSEESSVPSMPNCQTAKLSNDEQKSISCTLDGSCDVSSKGQQQEVQVGDDGKTSPLVEGSQVENKKYYLVLKAFGLSQYNFKAKIGEFIKEKLPSSVLKDLEEAGYVKELTEEQYQKYCWFMKEFQAVPVENEEKKENKPFDPKPSDERPLSFKEFKQLIPPQVLKRYAPDEIFAWYQDFAKVPKEKAIETLRKSFGGKQ